MLIEFKYGFEYRGFLYAWYRKELYRLPSLSVNKRKYGIKKLNIIKVGNKKGYRIKRDMLSITQCVQMTTTIIAAIHKYRKKHKPLI